MTVKQAIEKCGLVGRTFRAIEIADQLYPNARYDDAEGRVYNHSVPAVAKRLRKEPGIIEVEHGVFFMMPPII